jgi:hypothetical protein
MSGQASLLVLIATLFPQAEAPASAPVPGDGQDLVFFQKQRPCLLRLHLQIKGKPFRQRWDASVQHLFRFLDGDGNHALDARELARAPSVGQWRQLVRGAAEVDPEPAPTLPEVTGQQEAKATSLTQLRRFYQRVGGGPLQVRWARIPGGMNATSAAIFAVLDQDKNNELSRKELRSSTLLERLDQDGDEILLLRELQPGLRRPTLVFRPLTNEPAADQSIPFLVIDKDDPQGILFPHLLHHYDTNKNDRLEARELGRDIPRFQQLDANKDGGLDQSEWKAGPGLAVDLSLILPLEAEAGRKIEVVARQKEGLSLGHSPIGSVVVSFPNERFEVLRASGGVVGRALVLKQALQDFRKADVNNNQILERQEIFRPPFALVGASRLMDRDGDRQVTEKEYTAFVDLRGQLQSTTTFLEITDQGRSLLDLVDRDKDGRFSQRELRSAWSGLKPWVSKGQAGITLAQLPQQWRLVVWHGVSPPGSQGSRLLLRPQQGPVWFVKMDRNRDGDVSPSEFLGTAEQFRHLDSDGDGLLDAREARQADQKLRNLGR